MALPYLEVMMPAVRAAGGVPVSTSGVAVSTSGVPVRLACLFQPNGVFPAAWNAKGEGEDYELSPILQPLAKVRDDVLVLSNLDNCNGKGHVVATGGFLTGVAMKNRTNAVSLDQLVAQKIGHETTLPSIELGTEPPRQGGNAGLPISFANTVSWSSPTTRVSPEIQPRVAFDRMFRADATSKQKAEDTRSVLDLVRDEARRLGKKVSGDDRRKLDEYYESVRAVEKRIERSFAPKKRSWNPKTDPSPTAPTDGIPATRDEHIRMMLDLLVVAFQTDTTRVGTLMLAHGFSRQNFTFIGVKGDHHTISHHKNQKRWTDDYTTVSRWYIEQFVYLLERMKGIDEGGSSLLDNCMVLYGSGLKDGNGHKTKNLPILVAGRGGGSIRPGRRIVSPEGTPLTNLHLSLLQRMGVEAESFNTSTGTVDLG
jgi:hypothetical protein